MSKVLKIGIMLDGISRHIFDDLPSRLTEYMEEFNSNSELRETIMAMYPNREVRENEDWFEFAKFNSLNFPIFYDFLYALNGMTLFGNASDGSIRDLLDVNSFISLVKQKENAKIYVCGIEREKARLGTMAYLAKNNFTGDGVLFYQNYDDLVMDFDIIISKEPYLEKICRENEKIVLVKDINEFINELKK